MAAKVNGDSAAHHDTRLHDIILADQLPSDSWSEGIAVRPSGNLLVTLIEDDPQLLAINSASTAPLENEFDSIPPKLVHTFPDASGCFSICTLPGAKREEYAVVTGHADLGNAHFHGWAVWRVAMPPDDSDDAPEVSKIADLPDARFLSGIVAISDCTLAVVDCNLGCIWRVDVPSGQPSVLFEDSAFTPPASGEFGFFGINRMRFTEKYGWATNTASGVLYRFSIEYVDDGKDLKVTGPTEEVATGLTNADGLVMARDGSSAYVCSYTAGYLWRVDIEGEGGSGKGIVSVVRSDLVTPTAMDLIYSDKREKPTLYIVCCGSVSKEAALDGERRHWLGLANLDHSKLHITVTVTTEVTYEYIE